MRDDPDLPLIRSIAHGDRDALDALYRRHGLWLLNVLIGWTGDRAAAEDALQNVMVAVWQGARGFRGESQVTTWLYGIAQRQARRTRYRPTQALTESVYGENGGDSLDGILKSRVREAITTLPVAEQEALELVYYRALTISQAADQLGIPANTLKSRLIRARKRLRHLLRREVFD